MSRRVVVPVGFLAVVLIIAACESSPSPSPSAAASGTAAATPAPPPAGGRLALVQERGQLICGVNGGLPGFSFLDAATGDTTGFDADFCRAVAAAVLGDPTLVEFRTLNADARGPALQTGEVDVLIRNTTWTVSRDTDWGLFAPTTFYDGQGMMVRAADGIGSLADLEGATICVQTGTTTELNLADVFRSEGIDFTPLPFGEIEQTYSAYDEGSCDAVTSDRSQLVAQRTILGNPDDHVILDEVMSKEPLGPVVPLGDDEWFNVVKWVVFATFEAEERGITQDNVADMVGSDNPVIARLLGADGDLGLGLEADWAVSVISAVGNYGEIYDRNLGPGTPFDLDRGPNSLWTDGGLLYAPPYR
ncbi:MAG TPA: amino acid ABC transporter substrate-binding protein [Candidatus Limnocylindria bacterium]|jgi:general L-amino acid transport system substrate-binding protein